MVEKADGSWLCRGTAELAVACERAGVPPPESGSVTLSGYLAEQLGHVPTAGDVVDHAGFRFLVTKANNRRAERVLVARLPAPADEPPAAPTA